ncbi:hypothetical protein PBY51_016580 [Eleginops maclovinus]|uniref:Uncharacterized protein n=1 Tax=Eleginops maclovinus TaxID=56733 RepID=A0AAN7W7H0_ELEMC|nr:hypothetical protein PBY51_016580 [Eleginops maclovinus]
MGREEEEEKGLGKEGVRKRRVFWKILEEWKGMRRKRRRVLGMEGVRKRRVLGMEGVRRKRKVLGMEGERKRRV